MKRKEDINERMKSLLFDCGLSNRLVSAFNESILDDIDYSKVRNMMNTNIVDSKEYLKRVTLL